jgi:tetratricopeptide (TPR) repeat protein
MISHHPTQRAIEDFVLGRLDLPENHRIVNHLLGGCSQCREVTADVWERIERGLRAAKTPLESESEGQSSYEEVLDRVVERAGRRASTLDRERSEAHRLLDELGRHPLPRQLTLVRNSRRFRSWALCELLIEEGFRRRFDDPTTGLERIQLAVAVSDRVSEDEYGLPLVRDLQARAFAYLGNAERICSNYLAAEEAFRKARALLAEGTHDPLEKALVVRFEAHLAVAHRRFDLAPGLYDQAREIYRQCGEHNSEAMALLDKGYAFAVAERPADAVSYLEEGLSRLDAVAEPKRALAARHNLVDCLNDAGRHAEAYRRLEELRPAYRELGDRLNLLRLHWLEGKILERLDRTAEAEAALEEAREGFLHREMPFEAALVGLDLAALFVRLHRPIEVRRLAAQVLPVFESRRIERETLAALVAFHQAAQLERVTGAMIQNLATRLRNSKR